jgi:hypothetical protein
LHEATELREELMPKRHNRTVTAFQVIPDSYKPKRNFMQLTIAEANCDRAKRSHPSLVFGIIGFRVGRPQG